MVGLLLFLAIVLVGCGRSGQPWDMDERTYNIGLEALGFIDEFLDGHISAGDAADRMEELYDRLSEIEPSNSDHRLGHTGLRLDISMMGRELRPITRRDISAENVLSTRNRIARTLNQRER